MHRFALAAAFALLLVPTLGRLAQAAEGNITRDGWGAMCTVAGLSLADDAAQTFVPDAPRPQHDASGECPYCPLVAGLAVPTAVAVAIDLPADSAPSRTSVAPTLFRHPAGLGSRGPPFVS
jgi:hypothetical protein